MAAVKNCSITKKHFNEVNFIVLIISIFVLKTVLYLSLEALIVVIEVTVAAVVTIVTVVNI